MGELEEDEREEGESPGAPGPAHSLFVQRAADLNTAGRHDLAEEYARRALARMPGDAGAHIQLALARHGQGHTREGERILAEALALAPDSSLAYGVRALLRTDLGRYKDAESDVLEALRLDPEEAFLFRIYGQLVFKAGQLEKAEKLLRRSLELDPENERASALLALVLSEGKQQAQALQHGRRSLALAPDEEVGHIALGVAHLRGGRPFAARRHFREALRIDPDPQAEEAFLEADQCCRVVYLPMYYWSHVVGRLPGKNIGAWALFMLVAFGGEAVGLPRALIATLTVAYVSLCIYSWFAGALVRRWVKWFPPKL